jgi:hypothetical protein
MHSVILRTDASAGRHGLPCGQAIQGVAEDSQSGLRRSSRVINGGFEIRDSYENP